MKDLEPRGNNTNQSATELESGAEVSSTPEPTIDHAVTILKRAFPGVEVVEESDEIVVREKPDYSGTTSDS